MTFLHILFEIFMNHKIYSFIITYNLKSYGRDASIQILFLLNRVLPLWTTKFISNLKTNGLIKLCEKEIQLLNSRFTHDILFTGVKVICFTFIALWAQPWGWNSFSSVCFWKLSWNFKYSICWRLEVVHIISSLQLCGSIA